MTFVAIWAIWLCAAVVGALLLGYAAYRLKSNPRARRPASDEKTDEIADRRNPGSSSRASVETKNLDA